MIRIIHAASWVSRRRFYSFSHRLYRSDVQWREPSVWGGRSVLRPDANELLRYPHVLLMAVEGKTVLARMLTGTRGDGTGYFALFDAEKRPDAVSRLVDEAAAWQRKNGSEELYGPIAPVPVDLGGGVLADGFGDAPAFNDSYNKAYYDACLTGAGFERREEWVSYRFDLGQTDRLKYRKIAGWAGGRFGYVVSEAADEKPRDLAEQLSCIMEDEMDYESACRLIGRIGPLLAKGFCPCVSVCGEPVGILLTIRKNKERPRAVTLWVKKTWRRKGVTALLFDYVLRSAEREGLCELDGSMIRSDNLSSVLGAENAGGRVKQRYFYYQIRV